MSPLKIYLLSYLEPSRIWEPPCEDTEREAKLRQQQALSAAVDVPWLFKSAQAYTVELAARCYTLVIDSVKLEFACKSRKSYPCPCRRSFVMPCSLFGRNATPQRQQALEDGA